MDSALRTSVCKTVLGQGLGRGRHRQGTSLEYEEVRPTQLELLEAMQGLHGSERWLANL